jgi:hypothetical protein
MVVGLVLVSGGSGADPRTPVGLPGRPAPFLGTAVVGGGGRTAAIDAYGNVVDLRAGPAGRALVEVSAKRQVAGTVPAGAGIVARASLPGGKSVPLWRADSVRQRYVPGTNVLRTVADFGPSQAEAVHTAGRAVREAIMADRRWIARARPLGPAAPGWARRMYRRSLLVLRALTERRTGAVAAGARDGWAYVWPRDAAARFHGTAEPVGGRPAQGDAAGWVAAAAQAAGLRACEAGGSSRPHREPNGHWDPLARSPASRDASQPQRQATRGGSTSAARDARQHGFHPCWGRMLVAGPWTSRADYQEGEGGDYLGNAIASSGVGPTGMGVHGRQSSARGCAAEIEARFGAAYGLARVAGDPASGVDSAVAWAVRPFPCPALFPSVRRSLRRLLREREGRYGIVPSEDWDGGDPWTAPTAWTAWALAALGDRRAAPRLIGDLRRAATPLGLLPERVDARTGLPSSTTPLAWSHAFAILALRELWPAGGPGDPARRRLRAAWR